MATHGKSGTIYANGYDLTAYFTNIELSMSADTGETTALGAAAKAFVAGVKDATLSADGLFDGASNAVDQRMDTALGAAATPITITPAGDTDGLVAYGINAITSQYDVEAPAADVVSVTMSAQSNVGGERCIILHALAAETATANGTYHDNSGSSANGGSAYLHVTAYSGITNLIVTIEGDDNSGFSSATTLATFATVTTANVAERVTWTGTTEQYVRAVGTITGSGSVTYHVSYHRG